MVNKKKILFIIHFPPPIHGSSMVGEYIKDSRIINSSFDAQYINLSTSKTVDEIGKNPLVKISRYIQIISKVIIKLIRYNPETVYLAITAKGLGFYKDFPITLLSKLFGKKLVLHYHNKGVNLKQDLFFYNFMYRILFKNTKVILLSKRLYGDVKKYVKIENVFFCANGIPHPNFEVKISNNINKDKVPKLLFLSNLIESKGVYVLLKALKILNAEGVKFQCNFVGGEGDISSVKLNSKITDFNLEHCVRYLGEKHHHEKYEISQKSNIFILPTYYHNECFPLVLLEAMQFGLPIISSNEGGIPDIVKDGETGFIVEKQKPKQLAEKIKWLIDHPKEVCLMGEKGQKYFLEHYTLEVFEKRMTHILNQI
jgi:glycosyltransferase involved in cell wall biosynthesis